MALVIATGLPLLSPPPRAEAVDLPGPCDVPGVSVLCSAAGDAAGAAAGAAGDAVLGQLTSWVGEGASWLLLQVADAIDSTTSVNLSASWFQSHYAFMFQAGAILLLPLLLLTVLQVLIRQDGGLLIRVGLLHLPAAMLLTGLAVSVTQTALAVTDALSAELTAGVANDTHALASTLTQASAVGGPVPLFASFLMALVMALAAIFVWFELILRAGVVYVAVMFLPLFLATMIWPALSGWVRRLVQLIVAAILSKLVIVATLSLGLSALTSGDGPSAVLAGAGMFLLSAFSPFVLFSLIPLAAEIAQPQREASHAVATTTGTSLAWNVARTRMSFGAVGTGAGAFALGAGAMGGASGGGGSGGSGSGPTGGGGGAASVSPGGAPGGGSMPTGSRPPAGGQVPTVAATAASPAQPSGAPTSRPAPSPPERRRPAGPPPGAQLPLRGADGA
ncbi:hypothetical protein [Miltoncostaea oceani]|uniref:hypothetical protein n=1 Tax=Miltoncostaea oceani TaxID=2843216 RepID=UPI001C3E159F|nr:hypothetical protein [Miltoncostaea oceani]